MFKQPSFIGPNSTLAKELKMSTVNMFNKVPEESHDRNRAKLFQRYSSRIKERVFARSEELIDALTDLVKDFPTETEIKKAGDLLKEVLEAKDEKDLSEIIASIEESLSQSEKNTVLKEELTSLNNIIKKLMKEAMEFNWSDVEESEAEKLYSLSQILSMINSIIDSLLMELRINPDSDINNGVSALFYLTLRTNAYLMNKIQKESLDNTISAVQAFIYSHATYLVAN
jgi:hypothetical protein